MKHTMEDILKEGGSYIGAVHAYIQWNFPVAGSRVRWYSSDELICNTLQLAEMAASAVAADRNGREKQPDSAMSGSSRKELFGKTADVLWEMAKSTNDRELSDKLKSYSTELHNLRARMEE